MFNVFDAARAGTQAVQAAMNKVFRDAALAVAARKRALACRTGPGRRTLDSQRYQDRSKYVPHQAERERNRRRSS